MAREFKIKTNHEEYSQLYMIEEQCTTGWEVVKKDITKEQCKEEYDILINEGTAPSRIKVTRIQ